MTALRIGSLSHFPRPSGPWQCPLRKERESNDPQARSLTSLQIGPPFRVDRPAFALHLRRQISGDFHARADFDDDRSIPAHECDSLSFFVGSLSHEERN